MTKRIFFFFRSALLGFFVYLFIFCLMLIGMIWSLVATLSGTDLKGYYAVMLFALGSLLGLIGVIIPAVLLIKGRKIIHSNKEGIPCQLIRIKARWPMEKAIIKVDGKEVICTPKLFLREYSRIITKYDSSMLRCLEWGGQYYLYVEA